MGTLNPIGKTVDEYWHGLIEGRSGAAPLEGIDSSRLVTKFACQVKDFDPSRYMDRKLAQRSARFTQLALAASEQALADSGLSVADEDPYRVGVEMGTGVGGFEIMTRDAATFLNGGRLQPLYSTIVIPNIAPAQLAMNLRPRRPTSPTATPPPPSPPPP